MIDCPTCLAAEHATDESKATLLRLTHLKLDQARDALFPAQVALGHARDRIRELEEIIERQNKRLAGADRWTKGA